MLKSGDIDKSILEVFNSMEENIEYELTQDGFANLNNFRKENGYSQVLPFIFYRQNDQLVFDWKDNYNKWSQTKIVISDKNTTLAFALSLAENSIQKVKQVSSCEGKIVEIDGKKYKLTSV